MISDSRSGICLYCLLAAAIVSVCASYGAQTAPQDKGVTDMRNSVLTPETAGRYFALIVGVDHYQQLPRLATPVNDAREIADVLRKQYGFQTKLLLDADATRDQIIKALQDYRRTLSEADSLVVYFSRPRLL